MSQLFLGKDRECLRNLDVKSSVHMWDAPLARIRRMPHEDGFHIIHRKAMSVQGNTFGSVHTSARIRRKPQEVGLQIIHRKAMSVQMNTFFVIMIAIKIGIGVGLSIKMCNFAF